MCSKRESPPGAAWAADLSAAKVAEREFFPAAGKAKSLAERAYLHIRNQMLRGDLPAGAVLSRRQLAAELNISVPPVMEALQQLEREGMVESRPRAGSRVRIPTPQDVEERTLVREALETQAARLFAARATPAEKTELRIVGRRVDRLYGECDKNFHDRDFVFAVYCYHMKLHRRIAEGGRCSALRHAIEKEQALIFNWLYDTAVQRRTLGSNFHRRLTDALAGGSPAEAEAAMREHIQYGLKEVLEKLAQLDLCHDGGWRLKKSQPGR